MSEKGGKYIVMKNMKKQEDFFEKSPAYRFFDR